MTPDETRAARESLGLTIGQASRAFGIGRRAWARMESGEVAMRGPLRRLVHVTCHVPGALTALLKLSAEAPEATDLTDDESGG